ncbi:hypothetical protein [Streptomyces sp. NPDC003327]
MVSAGRPLAAPALLALLGLAAAGCANQEAPPRKAGAVLEVTRDSSYYEGRGIRLPFDAYELTREQRASLSETVYARSRACMREFGLDWPKPLAYESPVTANSRRYGVIDLPRAKEFGYGVPLPEGVTREEAEKTGRENIDRTRRLSQETRDVYTGEGAKEYAGKPVPEGGCRGRAYTSLGLPPLGMTSMTLDTLRYESWDRARKSRIVADAVARWSTCMSGAGYTYKTPEEAVADPAWRRGGGTPPSAAEIAAATADITCKREVMLVEKWYAVEVETQKSMVRERADALAKLDRERTSLVRRLAQGR